MDEREKKLFADWLRANGWNPDELNEAQQTSLEAAWRATGGDSSHAIDQPRQPDPEPEPQLTASDPVSHSDDPVCALRAAQAAELERVGQITALFAGEEPDLQLQAVRDGWDVTRAELALLRAQRDRAPAIHTHSSSESAPADVMEAACCAAGGLGDLEDQFSEQVLDAAHARFRHGIGLQDLLLEAAWANGYTGRRMRDDIEGVLRAAFSTLTLPGILSNNANKFLLEGFNYVESAWQQISSTRSVSDFKTHTSYRLTGDMQFIEVGAGGELAHGEVGEDSFTNQAKTYGRMFAITRTDIINDDLGALTAVPRRIGRGAALKLNDVFWTEFMDNSSFFSTGNANYWASATTGPLSSTGLQYAVKLFRKQTDPDGKPVGIEPKILLVPPDIEVEADELFVSTNLNTGGSSSTTKVPNRNVFAAKYRPVVSSYLSNTSYTGYSVVAWYLLADPMDVPVIETAFLNGQQTPTVESADADFNTLGIQMRGYFDFGVSKQEYRGGVKSKGAA